MIHSQALRIYLDIAMVFVVALIIALVSRMPQQAERSAEGQVPIQGESLQRYQVGESQIGGQGTRLGMAYQLESGEVIYVPQSAPYRDCYVTDPGLDPSLFRGLGHVRLGRRSPAIVS